MVRMNSAYELGRALNPRMVEQQLVGGAWMGISHALYETTGALLSRSATMARATSTSI